MEILYLGTICNYREYKKIINNSRIKPSIAPYVFDRNIIKGLSEISDVNLRILSYPMIAAFPDSKIIGWFNRREKILRNLETTWITAINIHLLKQLSLKTFSYFAINKWLQETRGRQRCILMYSIYYPIAGNVIRLCKRNQCRSIAIVTDLPRHFYTNARISVLKRTFSKLFINSVVKIQKKFDGYIVLTKNMQDVLECGQKSIIIEGIAEKVNPRKTFKTKKRAIMYAGALNRKYGLKDLIEAFIELKKDYELWIFGSGDYKDDVINYSKRFNNIKYFGHVPREKILLYEKKATLLVNIRPADEDFVKYSFPSKTIEYMGSGTPVLTSKLPGIPDEYYKYVFVIDDIDKKKLVLLLKEIMEKSDELLNAFGKRAASFIENNKNYKIQTKKIFTFLRSIVNA